ncbi:MAG: DsbA family protein [Schaedlerella sp.]|nr:DsbA family protein [Schaedlerella sp.]
MNILFISDYVCPYCLVAKEALKQACAELNIQPEMVYHAFELTEEPKPRVDTYNDANRKEHYKILVEPCKQLGLDMKLPPKVVPRPYSRLAFEGYYYAKDNGCGEAYNDLIYRAYFIDEKDIGDMDVLCELAMQAGLDVEGYKKVIDEGVYSEIEKKSVREAREIYKIDHVPTIYIDGELADIKKYTKEEFIEVLTKINKKDR